MTRFASCPRRNAACHCRGAFRPLILIFGRRFLRSALQPVRDPRGSRPSGASRPRLRPLHRALRVVGCCGPARGSSRKKPHVSSGRRIDVSTKTRPRRPSPPLSEIIATVRALLLVIHGPLRAVPGAANCPSRCRGRILGIRGAYCSTVVRPASPTPPSTNRPHPVSNTFHGPIQALFPWRRVHPPFTASAPALLRADPAALSRSGPRRTMRPRRGPTVPDCPTP